MQVNYFNIQDNKIINYILYIILLWGIVIFFFPLMNLWYILFFSFVLGFSYFPYLIFCNLFISKEVDENYLEQVYKSWSTWLLFPMPVGMMFASFLISNISLFHVLYITGGLLILSCIIYFIYNLYQKQKLF